MSERVSAVLHTQKSNNNPTTSTPSSPSCCLKTLIDSLNIFPRNKQVFVSIFTLLTLPLSLLLFSLSYSSFPTKSHVLQLESLASLASTRFEARHVWQESRSAALSLLRLKLLYFPATYLLSLLAAVSSIVSTDSAYHRRPISPKSALAAVKSTWAPPLITSICIYAVHLLYSSVPPVLVAIIGGANPGLGLVIRVAGFGLEVYLMAVMGLGLVVSILERRFGWDAIRVGSSLMEGRRVCGWVLSGLLAVVTGGIGWRMESLMMEMMDGEDLSKENGKKWTVVMVVEGWERVGLVGLYGLVVIWGYVVNTVFYCECRKRHVVGREEEEEEVEEKENVNS